jgi:MFS family permease
MKQLADSQRELREGLPVLLATVIGSAAGLIGIAIFAFPFFIVPLQAEFGWARSKIGIAVSFLSLTLIVSGPLAGRLCDRYGVRKIIPVSVGLFAMGLVALTQIRGSVVTLYLGYVVLAIVGAGVTYGCYSRAITTWFERNRGLALGLTASGPGLTAVLVPQVLPRVIDAHGWRAGWYLLAGVALVGLPLVLLFIRERPVAAATAGGRTNLPGMSVQQVRRTRTFWTLAIGIFVVHCGVSGMNLHLVPMLGDLGASTETVRIVATVFGLSMSGSRVLTGFLLDRLPGPAVAAGVFGAAASGLALTAIGGPKFAVLCAVGLGLATGAEGDLIGYFVSRYFGLAAFSELFGWLYGALALGATAGPLLTGALYDSSGHYSAALMVSAGCCLFTAAMYSRLGPYPVVFAKAD